MLCEKCKTREATTHVKNLVNSKYSEYMLCDDCARNMGFSSFISDMQSEFTSLFDSLFSNALPARSGATRCRKCGSSYTDIISRRRIGCDECFETFKDEIKNAVVRVHGNAVYSGKMPRRFEEEKKKEEQIKKLREELELCVRNEEYEKAASLRDEIRGLEA